MAAALGLARRGLGCVWPNPAVGCVIVRDGRVVGRGFTQPGGRPHAERIALDQAGPAAQGATASGESQWITGPQSRARVHLLRAQHDAIFVGGGTARADDPLLTQRGLGIARQPVRLIAARNLDLPDSGRLAASASETPLWLFHGASAPADRIARWQALGARLIPLPETAEGLDPTALLQALGAEGLTRLFCEGGGQLAAALLRAGLVDDLITFTAGLALGADGRPALGPLPGPLADAPRFRLISADRIGDDMMLHWTRA